MRRVLFLALKDLRQRIRDRTAVTVGLVAPLVLVAIVGAALGDLTSGPRITLAWVDLDGSKDSAALAAAIVAGWPGQSTELVRFANADEADSAVAGDRAMASVVVPAGFARALAKGEAPPPLRVRTSRSYALGGRLADALVARAWHAFATRTVPPAPVEVRAPQGRLRAIDHYGPSLTVLFLFFQLLGGMRAFGAEAENGTLARLAATPISGRDIFVGKVAALALLGALQFAVLYVASRFLFGVAWGPLPLVAALAATTIAGAIGLMGAAIAAGGPHRGYLLGMLLLFVLSLLGGQFLPPEGLPDFFDGLARGTPNGQALRGFTDLAAAGAEARLATIAEPLAVTAAVGVIGIAFCARRLRASTAAVLA